jgi:arylsulfatase A-like enzyme
MADGSSSDGADVVVRVDGIEAARVRVAPTGFEAARIDLAPHAGRRVRLELSTEDADTTRDHVFLGAPALYTPRKDPRRVVLVFVDTLRQDHLGLYGYTRATSPRLDAWARDAVVFDQARSVAPWTLPSARSVLSGRHPEAWEAGPTLPERLAAHGWATAAYVGNVYLSSNFDMAGGWGEHGCVNWPSAEVEARRARDFLARHPDRDALLLVHFMDMHLPYKEPSAYRSLFAGDPPPGLGETFGRSDVLSVAQQDRDALRTYLVDRYDQNLRYIDDALAGVLADAGPDAVVVLFSDHGEEFWDHGDFEHGHTLYDELLRVPLVVRAPGLGARRVDAPTSLLDVTPTVLDLLGLPVPALDGRSLANLARTGEDATFAGRPIGFGRVLYGNEAWGSVVDGRKYTSRSGAESIHDLRADAAERVNLRPDGADPAPGRAALATAVGRPVTPLWRITLADKESGGPYTAELTVPAGIARAWVGDDPAKRSQATLEQPEPTRVTIKFAASRGTFREIFVLPEGDALAAAADATLKAGKAPPVPLEPVPFDGLTTMLGSAAAGRNRVVVTWAVMPLPAEATVSAEDEEMRGALEAMGYLDAATPSAATPATGTQP